MKLRSIICVSAIATAAAASALTTTNTFARLPVTSSYTNTIVSIPLAGCGEMGAQIYVTNLVMTSNLKAGDRLVYKDGSTYYAWHLTTDGGSWQQMATSTDFGLPAVTPSAESTALGCGKACWLIRARATFGSDDKIYLFGQVLTGSKPTVTVAAGTSNALTYTIIGYPSEAENLDLYSWNDSTKMATGDLVIVPDTNAAGQKTYRYSGSAWTKATTSTKTVTTPKGPKTVTTTSWTPVASGEVTIAAGTGFMYGRKATSSATFAW